MRVGGSGAALVAGAAVVVALFVALTSACGKSTPGASTLTPDGSRPADAAASGAVGAAGEAARDPQREELWKRAKESGEEGDLARLADREGEAGLRARAEADGSLRLVAIKALAHAPEPGVFYALPFLARVAGGGDDAESAAALESVVDVAARPRRAIDPEDAAELKEGCDALLAVAKGPGDGGAAARSRRVMAIRALRMLADRGCVEVAAIPADLDAR